MFNNLKINICNLFRISRTHSRARGFTFIELLITLIIITMMALIVIPAFSKYGDRRAFDQKTTEIESALNEIYTDSINPAKGVDQYIVFADSDYNKITFFSDNVETKSITMPSSYSINLSPGDNKYLVCDTAGKVCCLNTTTTTCSSVASGNYFTLTDDTISKTATFNIQGNPFRVQIN